MAERQRGRFRHQEDRPYPTVEALYQKWKPSLGNAGGFLEEDVEDEETAGSSRNEQPQAVHPSLIGHGIEESDLRLSESGHPICNTCDKEFPASFYYDTFANPLCDACKNENPEGNRLVTRTEAKDQYLLKDVDLDRREPVLRFIRRKNPHNPHWGDMKLYLRSQVWKRAIEIHGSGEALTEAKERRQREAQNRKEKQFESKLKALRKQVRGKANLRKVGVGMFRRSAIEIHGSGEALTEAKERRQREAQNRKEKQFESKLKALRKQVRGKANLRKVGVGMFRRSAIEIHGSGEALTEAKERRQREAQNRKEKQFESKLKALRKQVRGKANLRKVGVGMFRRSAIEIHGSGEALTEAKERRQREAQNRKEKQFESKLKALRKQVRGKANLRKVGVGMFRRSAIEIHGSGEALTEAKERRQREAQNRKEKQFESKLKALRKQVRGKANLRKVGVGMFRRSAIEIHGSGEALTEAKERRQREAQNRKEKQFESKLKALRKQVRGKANLRKVGVGMFRRSAIEIHGSGEALTEAKERRQREAQNRKEKQFESKLKALRKQVRGKANLRKATVGAHTHKFGEEVYDAEADSYSKTCSLCDHVETYEKM